MLEITDVISDEIDTEDDKNVGGGEGKDEDEDDDDGEFLWLVKMVMMIIFWHTDSVT